MDHRSPVLGLMVLCLCTATPATAQDKRALIEKLMEVQNISGQIQSATQSAVAQMMTQIKKKIRRFLTIFPPMCKKKWKRNFQGYYRLL